MGKKLSASKTSWSFQEYFDLLVIGATHGLSDGFSGLLKPILILIVLDLGLSNFQAGTLLSIFTITTFLFIFPLSLLADIGGRKKEILIIGLSIATIAFFSLRWAPNFAVISLCVFLAGAGNATFHPSGTALTTARFPKSRPFAVSVYSMMGNTGSSLMPFIQSLIAASSGWRDAISMSVLPALLLLPLVGARFNSSSKLPPRDNSANKISAQFKLKFQEITKNVFKKSSDRNISLCLCPDRNGIWCCDRIPITLGLQQVCTKYNRYWNSNFSLLSCRSSRKTSHGIFI